MKKDSPIYVVDTEEVRSFDGTRYLKMLLSDGTTHMKEISSGAYTYDYLTSGRSIRSDLLYPGPTGLSVRDYFKLEKEMGKVNIITKKSYKKDEHTLICNDKKDLSTDRVLKTLSAIKGRLMLETAPLQLKAIECSMTPEVRKNIITASKRLKMYGKKRPIIACFDEYGNSLPDTIDLGTSNGITLKIVDPDDFGTLYLELKGIEFTYNPASYDAYIRPDDLPF